jgi:hypothetical protein
MKTAPKNTAHVTPRVKLYHLTSETGAADIKKAGFKPGPDGLVWFAEHPAEVWGNSHGAMLLQTELPDSLISPYSHEFVADEVLNHSTGQWETTDEVDRGIYYALPPEVANLHKPRRVFARDKKRMMS